MFIQLVCIDGRTSSEQRGEEETLSGIHNKILPGSVPHCLVGLCAACTPTGEAAREETLSPCSQVVICTESPIQAHSVNFLIACFCVHEGG